MKRNANRALSILLVLAMCLSLLSGLSFSAKAATVEYVTGDAEDNSGNVVYSDVILNWGTRGTKATFLSPNAIEFYSDNSITYAALSAYSGSSDTASVPDSSLYSQLASLMKDNHSTITSYDDVRWLLAYTDCQENTLSKLTGFYSGKSINPVWDSGATWNREHVWPNSKGLGGNDENDVIMLRATTLQENGDRSNTGYGESDGYFYPNDASGGAYDVRGDVARTLLYVYVRWGNHNLFGSASASLMESKEVLLSWMEEDPVDTWEMGRNDSVESITGTRNVFIDYPELAFLLFGEEVPSMDTPSGEAASGSFTITAVANNSSYGSVSVSGRTINAAPAAGYEVTGCQVTSGTATVTRDGNAFTVVASSDCTVRIDFAALDSYTVSFEENGVVVSEETCYDNATVTLPAHSSQAPEGFSFVGWVTEAVEQTTAMPATVYFAGSSYTVVDDVTLLALYSRVDSSAAGNSGNYEEFSGNLVEGDYIIIYDDAAMVAADADSSGRLDYVNVTYVDNSIQSPDASIVWHLAQTADGYWTMYNEAAGVYAAGNGKNKAKVVTSVVDLAKWTASGSSTYEFVNLGNSNNGVNANLRRNSTYGFACYSTSTGGALTLYKAISGAVYYSTSADLCQHSNTVTVEALPATCIEAGYTEGVYCNDCESYISGHEAIEATGHNYNAVVTPPTTTEQGFTTYTCANCGDSYVDDYVDALGEEYTVSFVVPEGVSAIEDMNCNTSGITLPAAQAPDGYTFAGWVTASVDNVTEAPEILSGEYVAESDVTLYALYTYTVGEVGTGEWQLVTNAAQLAVGDQVVMTSNAKGKVAGDITSQYLSEKAATFSEDKSTITELPADALIFTLGTKDGSWTLTKADGTALGVTSVKNLSWSSGTTTFSISITDGDATIESTTSTLGRFIHNVNSPRFTTYTSNTSVSMLLPQLYKLDVGSGVTYYTTVIVDLCDHSETELRDVVEVSCTANGYTGDTWCTLCEKMLSAGEVVVSSGHNYTGVVTAPTVTEQGYTTYTCSICGDSYVADYVDALGETYKVSFVVPYGVDAIESMDCNKTGITLPTAGVPEGEYTYTFAGWVTASVDNVTEAPEILSGEYVAESDITLYALYLYSEAGDGAASWNLVTDASTLAAGDKLLIASNTKGVVNGDISSQYLTKVSATFSDDKSTITAMDDAAVILTLGGTEGAWTLSNAAGKLLGATTVKKLAWGSGTTTWSISISSDGATIQNGTSSYGRMLYNVTSPRFTTYTSNTSTSMLLPQLYKEFSTSVTYYTTEFGCPHVNTEVRNAAASTCAKEGYTGDTWCVDCETIVIPGEAIATLPHNLDGNGFCDKGCYEPAVLNNGVYEIGNAGQLYWFAQKVNNGETSIKGKLIADIVVNENVLSADGTLNEGEFRTWTPIGAGSVSFSGSFDGAYHTVSGLYANDPDAETLGLFGTVGNAEGIMKVGVVDSWFQGGEYVGGVVGMIARANIKYCWSESTVSGTGYVGGVAGSHVDGNFVNCYHIGTVSGSGDNVGGVAGYCAIVTNCYHIGTVNAEGMYVGGVAGCSWGELDNCYNIGNVSGDSYVGGLAGYYDLAVNNSYHVGTVTGNSNVGILAGNSNAETIVNCYYLSETEDGNGGKTAAQFASGEVAYLLQSGIEEDVIYDDDGNLVDYGIEKIWGQTIGEDDYPVLKGDEVYQTFECDGTTANGFSNTEGLKAEHSYSSVVTAPTCTAAGFTTHTCSACGDSYTDNEVAATGHSYVDGVCSVCGAEDPNYVAPVDLFKISGANVVLGNDLTMNFALLASNLDGTDYYAEIVKYNPDGTTITTTYPFSVWTPYAGGAMYLITLDGLVAKQMSDKVEVTIYTGDGVQASYTWEDSIRDYSIRQLNADSNSAKVKTCVADMLNYGAAAQVQFNYNTSDLANATMTDVHKSYATASLDFSQYTNNQVVGDNFFGTILALETNIKMGVFFRGTGYEGYTAKVSYRDHNGNAVSYEVAGADFDATYAAGGMYGIMVDTLVAGDVYQVVTVEVYNGETLVASVSESMESYVVRQSASLLPIYDALMKFMVSSYNYSHN